MKTTPSFVFVMAAMGLALASPARASIYSQSLSLNGDGGGFSYPLQQWADAFRLSAAATLQKLDWYGDNILNTFPSDVSFRVDLYQDIGGLPATASFASELVTATATDTGLSEPDAGTGGTAEIVKFGATLPTGVSLAADTTYWLSILDQTPPMDSSDNIFRWANGTSSWPEDPPSACCSPDFWHNDFGPPREQAAYDLTPAPVPEPPGAALLAAALAGLYLIRREAAPVTQPTRQARNLKI